jgi:biotin carboxyl carrier protein
MKFDVGIDGRTWIVDVEPRNGALAVTVDGQVTPVDAVAVDGGLSLIFTDQGLASRDVRVQAGTGPGGMTVHVGGAAVQVTVQRSGRTRRAGPGAGSAAAAGARRVLAPMPGRVVRVLVRQGEQVEARQGLVVIEAMKMENELKAPKAGVVTAVEAVEGATVDAGSLLAVVE